MATCVVSSNESAINGMVGMVADVEIPTEVPHNVAEIVLVRHGETTWNNAGRIQGSLESSLTNLDGTKTCHIPEVVEVPDLKERHVGSLQGYTGVRFKRKSPRLTLPSSLDKDLEIPCKQLDTYFNRFVRDRFALEEIASKHKGERVIVVTHGGILRAIYMAVTGESSAGKILNASINVVHLTEKKWVFKTWSDVSHLNEVGFLQRGFNGDAIQH
ncbi:hypothetical protein MKW92_037708 [Papaver armeniacum]|nr:hypothetical protein MKW92_037708 [Papaver armeniacum]